jgi:xanthine dehydrogenase/oxidase
MNISLLKDVNWENLRTIQRSRGVGEPPLFLGSCVFFAIRDALKAARKQWGEEGLLSLRSPATVERIRVSCADPLVKRAAVVAEEGEKSFFISI